MDKKNSLKKRFLSILFLTLIFSITVCYAQEEIKWTEWDKTAINGMELQVKSISGFTFVSNDTGFDLSEITAQYETPPNAIHIPEHRNLIKPKNDDFCTYLKFEALEAPWNCIRRDIAYSRGEEQEDPISHATFLPAEYAKKKFNADEVITYLVSLKEGPLKDKYANCEAICIAKKDRGFILLYCLYNNKKELDKNRKKLEKMFWFRDPKDFINPVPEPSDEEIIIDSGVKQRRI